MNEAREARFRRLMAWFPVGWRAEWEEVVIGSLLDDADRRGLHMIPDIEAWSLRGHGLVERITAARASLATAALVMAVAGSASLFLISPAPQVAAVLPVLSTLVGPLLLAGVVAAMAYRGGLLTVRGVGASLLLGAAALVGAYLARWSWSVGFDEADAGRPQSWFAEGFVPLLLVSWLLGAAAFLPLLLGSFRDLHHRPLRYVLAGTAAAAAAVAVGMGLIAPASCALVAAATTTTAQWSGADSDWQWPLMLIAAALAGFTVGTLTMPVLPVKGFPQIALTLALSAAAAGTIGIPTVTIGPITAPLIALFVIVQTLRRPHPVTPQPAAAQPLGTV